MSLRITFDDAGSIAGMQAVLEQLKEMGSVIGGVELHAIKRTAIAPMSMSTPSNVEIVDDLIKADRDFFTADEKTLSEMSEKARSVFQESIEAWQRRIVRNANRNIKAGMHIDAAIESMKEDPNSKFGASATAGKALRETMRVWMRAIVERIQGQKTADGGSPKPLSPKYAAQKKEKYGHTKVGILTSQLLDNLIADGPGAAGIRLTKNK